MKRNKVLWAVIGIIIVSTLFVATIGWAQAGNVRRQGQTQAKRPNVPQQQRNVQQQKNAPRGNVGMGFNLAELELSEEQKAQIQEESRKFQVDTAEIRQKVQFTQRDLQAEMRKDPVDQAKVDSLWAEIATLKKELGAAQVNHMLAIRSILTTEQLEKLQETGATARELQELKAELREILMASGVPDAARLQQLQAEIAEKEVALARERAEKLAQRQDKLKEKMESLTPEQREKIEQFRKNRGAVNPPRR